MPPRAPAQTRGGEGSVQLATPNNIFPLKKVEDREVREEKGEET